MVQNTVCFRSYDQCITSLVDTSTSNVTRFLTQTIKQKAVLLQVTILFKFIAVAAHIRLYDLQPMAAKEQ